MISLSFIFSSLPIFASLLSSYSLQPSFCFPALSIIALTFPLPSVPSKTPCQLGGVGSDAIVAAIKTELGIAQGETTSDGLFTFIEVECLGACVNAPMIQINDEYYEDLTPETTTQLLRAIRANHAKDPRSLEMPKPGPQGEGARSTCENSAGLTNLKSEPWGTETTRKDL